MLFAASSQCFSSLPGIAQEILLYHRACPFRCPIVRLPRFTSKILEKCRSIHAIVSNLFRQTCDSFLQQIFLSRSNGCLLRSTATSARLWIYHLWCRFLQQLSNLSTINYKLPPSASGSWISWHVSIWQGSFSSSFRAATVGFTTISLSVTPKRTATAKEIVHSQIDLRRQHIFYNDFNWIIVRRIT